MKFRIWIVNFFKNILKTPITAKDRYIKTLEEDIEFWRSEYQKMSDDYFYLLRSMENEKT